MKLSAAKIKECEKWVELNGLYPQRCGASVKEFCNALDISFKTYKAWCENSNFSNAITHAREVFQQNTVFEVTNALVKAAKGVDFVKEKSEYRAQVVKEYDPVTGKKVKEYIGKPIQTKALKESYYYPPDVNAAKFILTNLDPLNWKNKQDTATDLSVEFEAGAPVIVFSDKPSEAQEQPAPPAGDEHTQEQH